MKNVILLLLVAVCVYQYMNPRVEVQIKEVRVEAPSRPQGPKLYYHSPLDAPAMATSLNTGTGYYSTGPLSRFNNALSNGGGHSGGGGHVPPHPVAAPVVDSTNPLASVDALQTKLNEPTP